MNDTTLVVLCIDYTTLAIANAIWKKNKTNWEKSDIYNATHALGKKIKDSSLYRDIIDQLIEWMEEETSNQEQISKESGTSYSYET